MKRSLWQIVSVKCLAQAELSTQKGPGRGQWVFQNPEKSLGSRPCHPKATGTQLWPASGNKVYSRLGVGVGKVGCFFERSSRDRVEEGQEEGQPLLGWRAGLPDPGGLSLGTSLGPFHKKEPEALGLHGHRIPSQELRPGVKVPLGPATPRAVSQVPGGWTLGSSCPASKPARDCVVSPVSSLSLRGRKGRT